MNNNIVRLVALSSGVSKKTGKVYYRALFMRHLPSGEPVVKETFINSAVGDACRAQGLIENVDVELQIGLNQYLNFEIVGILPAEEEAF